MGLCYSLNREARRLRQGTDVAQKRSFQGETRLCKLQSIYDGDTFRVITRLNSKEPFYNYSIRLAGIDAPEMKPPMSDPIRNLHKQAAVAVRDLLRDKYPPGSLFLVDFDREDKYGRLLGRIWTTRRSFFGLGRLHKDKDLCQWMIDKGLVVEYGGQSKQPWTEALFKQIIEQCGRH